MKYKALVTGGTGFLGRELVRNLIELNWEVDVFTRSEPKATDSKKNCTYHLIPSSNTHNLGEFIHEIFSVKTPDVIFHLATAQPKVHQTSEINEILNANIALGTHLLEASSKLGGIPFINTGTYWQYTCGTETSPVNLYAASKSAFFEIIKYYKNVLNNPIVNLILVDTYGEEDHRKKVIDILIDSSLSGETIDFSPGEQELDFIHATDVAAGIIHAAKQLQENNLPSSSYALKTGKTINLKCIAKIVEGVTGAPVNINWGGKPYAPQQIMKTNIPQPRLPDWEPKISLHEGIRRLVAARL